MAPISQEDPAPHPSSHAPDPLHPQSILVLVLKSGALCAVQRVQYAPEKGQGDSRLVGVGAGADVLEVCCEYTEGSEWKGSEEIV